jgi:CRP-like cAMP-binding protein
MDARVVPLGINGILRHLSKKTLAVIEPHLHKMKLAQGVVLQETGQPITNVYFPLSGMVSMLAVLKTGEAIEAGHADGWRSLAAERPSFQKSL